MQGDFLLNASPVPTKRMLMDGYDRGFGFFPGVAIAQSLQKGETPSELTQLQQEHPQVVGLGIEESTALIVHGHTMEVVGKNQVAVLDGSTDSASPRSAVLQPGDRYDFKDRARVSRKESIAQTLLHSARYDGTAQHRESPDRVGCVLAQSNCSRATGRT